jgi:hypothetical protein
VKCSCGCGRSIPFGDRRANRRAAIARTRVEEMEALAFAADEDEYRRAFLFEGVSWRNQYTRVVYGQMKMEQTRSEAAWSEWRTGAENAVGEARRERQRRAARNA